MLILFFVSWYALGFCSFVFWWTKDYDFTPRQLCMALVGGFLGLFSFFIGWHVHGNLLNENTVLISKRTSRTEC